MRRGFAVSAAVIGLVLLCSAYGFAAHGEKRPEKRAILLAAFGTTVPEAQKTLDQVTQRVRQAFPGVDIRWGYTSSLVRKKLAKQGKVYDSPETALSRLMDEGYTHVAVLSLHTIPGEEFHDLNRNCKLFGQMAGGFDRILVAWPLLSSHDDTTRAATAVLKHIPRERKPQDAVILMGHGSEHHPADAMYSAMNIVLQEMDPNVFIATVEGYPSLEDILPKLEKKGARKVYLMPFMAVAGDHARNDMAGDDPDSWKSVLKKKGYTCEVVLKGTAEYPDVVDIWLDHLRSAFAHFN
ncbi:MAG: sirohydrochlorin cobaltochelatase [Deltaproteobacteria bacterium]|nr:sirohydrochlorin cobaltochelatase [Deltaproteobacteria bacterium]